jgi:hypothetical protein
MFKCLKRLHRKIHHTAFKVRADGASARTGVGVWLRESLVTHVRFLGKRAFGLRLAEEKEGRKKGMKSECLIAKAGQEMIDSSERD